MFFGCPAPGLGTQSVLQPLSPWPALQQGPGVGAGPCGAARGLHCVCCQLLLTLARGAAPCGHLSISDRSHRGLASSCQLLWQQTLFGSPEHQSCGYYWLLWKVIGISLRGGAEAGRKGLLRSLLFYWPSFLSLWATYYHYHITECHTTCSPSLGELGGGNLSHGLCRYDRALSYQGISGFQGVMEVCCVRSWIPSGPGSVGLSRSRRVISSWHSMNQQSSSCQPRGCLRAAGKLRVAQEQQAGLCSPVLYGFGTSQPLWGAGGCLACCMCWNEGCGPFQTPKWEQKHVG